MFQKSRDHNCNFPIFKTPGTIFVNFQTPRTKHVSFQNFSPKDQFCNILTFKSFGLTFYLKYMLSDWFWQILKVGGLKLPILQTLLVFHLFLLILHLKHIKHNFEIFLAFWCSSECFCIFAVQIRPKMMSVWALINNHFPLAKPPYNNGYHNIANCMPHTIIPKVTKM